MSSIFENIPNFDIMQYTYKKKTQLQLLNFKKKRKKKKD